MKTALDAVAWKAQTGKTVSEAYASSAVILPRVKARTVKRGDPTKDVVTLSKGWIADGSAGLP